VITLEVADLVVVAGRTLGLDTGQVLDLLTDKLRLEQELTAGVRAQVLVAENQRLRCELDRLRGLLREHGIVPDDGSARTA
jgi:hypothetical protein